MLLESHPPHAQPAGGAGGGAEAVKGKGLRRAFRGRKTIKNCSHRQRPQLCDGKSARGGRRWAGGDRNKLAGERGAQPRARGGRGHQRRWALHSPVPPLEDGHVHVPSQERPLWM